VPPFGVEKFLSEYPPPAFHFKVVFALDGGMVDTSFQDVSGISATLKTQEISQGGENESNLALPERVEFSNLVLKRGIAPMASPLRRWCSKVLTRNLARPIVPSDVRVFLMNEKQIAIRSWCFVRAYPVKWSVDPFNSTKNDVAIETIELKYHHFYRMT
jgi:phage tail-like protein